MALRIASVAAVMNAFVYSCHNVGLVLKINKVFINNMLSVEVAILLFLFVGYLPNLVKK